MTTLRRFCCDDLFTFNAINLDPLTETVRRSPRCNVDCCLNSVAIVAVYDLHGIDAPWQCLDESKFEICIIMQYHFSFYLEYLAKWPEYCQMAVGSSNDDIAYGALPVHTKACSAPFIWPRSDPSSMISESGCGLDLFNCKLGAARQQHVCTGHMYVRPQLTTDHLVCAYY